MTLPNDNFMLLSIVNMKLRDEFSSLEDFCASEDISERELKERLAEVGFEYDPSTNQFK